jgi:hypothetical protein
MGICEICGDSADKASYGREYIACRAVDFTETFFSHLVAVQFYLTNCSAF